MRVPRHVHISSLRSSRASFKYTVPETEIPVEALSETAPAAVEEAPAPVAVEEAPAPVAVEEAPASVAVEEAPAPIAVKRTRKRKAELVEAPVEETPVVPAETET